MKTSLALEPSMVLLMSSEATQPSAASGCHALVPTSYVDAMGEQLDVAQERNRVGRTWVMLAVD